jgi:TonB family protein
MNPVFAGQHWESSHCGSVEYPHAIMDLMPWFERFEGILRHQRDYNSFLANLRKVFRNGDNVICTFTVSKFGAVRNLRVAVASGDDNVDKTLVSLVRRATRYLTPPNNLPAERGIQIEFWMAGSDLYFWSQLDKSTASKKIEVVDYLGSKREHPWKRLSGTEVLRDRFRAVDGMNKALVVDR